MKRFSSNAFSQSTPLVTRIVRLPLLACTSCCDSLSAATLPVQDWTFPMEIDRVPLNQLPSRYGIARSALYTRLKDLKIEPAKEGKRAYIDAHALQLLDALHEHIQKGGTTGEFLKQQSGESPGLSRTVEPPEESSPGLSRTSVADSPGQILLSQPAALITVVEAIVKRLVPFGGRLNHLRELEEAYEKGWLLSTSEVADLLKLSPATVRGYGEQFEDAGFVFTRAGTRKRGEVAWEISKRPLSG